MNVYILRHGETKKNRVKSIKKQQSQLNLSDSLLSQELTLVLPHHFADGESNVEADPQINTKVKIASDMIIFVEDNHHIYSSCNKPTKITLEDAVDKDSVLNGNGYRQCEKTAEYIAQLELSSLLDLPQGSVTNLVITESTTDGIIPIAMISPREDDDSIESIEPIKQYCRNIRIFSSPVSRTIQSAEHIRYVITELLKEADMFVFDKNNIKFDIVVDHRLYDTNGDESDCDVNKMVQLKQFLNNLFLDSQQKKQNNDQCDDLLIVVTHNHIIELFYKMICENGVDNGQGGKKKFHNCSISQIQMKNLIDTSENGTKCAERNLTGEWDFVDHIDHMDLIKRHIVVPAIHYDDSTLESSLDNSMIIKIESDTECTNSEK